MNDQVRNWPARALAECGQFLSGGTPNRGMPEYWGGTIPWISAKSLKTFRVADSEERVTEAGAENGTRMVAPGTVLFVVRGMSLAKEFRVAVTTGPVTFNQDLRALVPSADVDAVYLTHFLRASQQQVLGLVDHASHGTTRLTSDRVDAIRVPVPPLAEQRRIAEVLDRAEALRTKRRAALSQLDTLTQAIFQDLFGDPLKNSKRLPTALLGNVATFVGGGTPSRDRPDYFTGKICWATSKDMKGEYLDDTEEHVTDEAVANSATKLVPPDTILVVVKSKILAHHLPVAISRVACCFGQDLKGIRLDDRCDTAFVATALRIGKRWLLERARGINTEGLTLEHLRAFPLVLPSRAQQQDFAGRFDAVEKLKSAQRASLAELDALFASLQHRAFRGEL